MTGKEKCKLLKEIRKEIARQNEIKLVTSECKYQGECKGTCPKCEEELRILEKELAKRKTKGAVLVAGMMALSMGSMTGCTSDNNIHIENEPEKTETVIPTDSPQPTDTTTLEPDVNDIQGDIAYAPDATQSPMLESTDTPEEQGTEE